MANWTVDTVDQIQTTGSTVASQVVDLTITNVINGVYNGYNLSASDFKIGEATNSATNEWTGGNVGSPESNYSVQFDGLAQDATGDLITFTQTSFDVDGATYSFAFWAKKANATDDMIVLGRTGAGANSYNSLIKLDGTTGKLEIESDAGGPDLANATVTDDTNWHHYVITVSSGTVVMYQDGVAKSVSGDINGGNLTMDSLGGGGLIKKYKGELYQVAIWNAVLDADAVTAIYNSGVPIPLKEDKGNYDNSGNLIHLWRFSEGSGTTTADSVGSLTGTFQDDVNFNSTTPDYRSGAVSKVVFSDNGTAGDPANTVKASVHLNNFTCPIIADTIYVDIDEATAPTLLRRDVCFRIAGTSAGSNETVSNTNVSNISITGPYTTQAQYEGFVNDGVSTKVAETTFTANSGYHYGDPPLGVSFMQNNSMLSLGFDYTNQYHITISKTYTNNLVTSFVVRIFYTPGQNAPLFPDPDNLCEFNHHFTVNRRLLQTTTAVTNTITGLSYTPRCTYTSQSFPVTVRGIAGTMFTLRLTQNTSTTSSAIASSNGYFNWTTRAFQTGNSVTTGTIGANGRSIFMAALPEVSAETHYSLVLASHEDSTIPTDMNDLGEQTIIQYGQSCLTIQPGVAFNENYEYLSIAADQSVEFTGGPFSQSICRPTHVDEAAEYTHIAPRSISVSAGNNNTSGNQITLGSAQVAILNKRQVRGGMLVVGLGSTGSSGTHNLKIIKVQDKEITLSDSVAVPDDTTVTLIENISDVIPFEIHVAPAKNNTTLTVSRPDPDTGYGRQPSLTRTNTNTSFIGDVGGFQDVVVLTNGGTDGDGTASTSITLDNTIGIVPGMVVTGTGISGTVTVSSITSATVLVLSSTQTVGNDVSMTFTSQNTGVSVIDIQATETEKNSIIVQGLLVVENITAAQYVYVYIDNFIRGIFK